MRNKWKFMILAFIAWTQPIQATAAETFAIISLKLDGTDLQMLASDPKQNLGSVDVSPDGKRIAYDAWPLPKFVNTNQWIYVANIDGSKQKKIIKGGIPKWSPDSQLIAFQDYVTGVAVVQPDGGGKELVSPNNGNPSWIDGGNSLVVLEWGRNLQIVDLINGGFRRLDPNGIPGILWGSAVSKDGKKVCYSQRTGKEGVYDLVITNLDGNIRPQVHRKGALGTGFGWHPDGKRVVFAEGAMGSQLFIINVETGKVEPVPCDKKQAYVNPCFSPDGKRIFCSSTIRLAKAP